MYADDNNGDENVCCGKLRMNGLNKKSGGGVQLNIGFMEYISNFERLFEIVL